MWPRLVVVCRIVCALASGMLSMPGEAEVQPDIVILDGSSTHLSLTPHTRILFDERLQLGVEDLQQVPSQEFRPLSELGNALGFNDAAIWLHIRLRAAPGAPAIMLLSLESPMLDHVSIFTEDGSGGFTERRSGDKQAYSQRLIAHRFPIFTIPVSVGQEQDIYLRLKSRGSIQIPLYLWKIETFIGYQDQAQLLFGAYYGLMLILALASLYAYLMLRERVFFRYSAYLFAFLLFQLAINGVAFQFLWGEIPEFASRINSSLVGIVVIAALWFSSEFLKLEEHTPSTHRLFHLLQAFSALSILLVWTSLFQPATKLLVLSGILLVPLFALAAIQVLRQDYKPARYFTAAWGVLMAGVFASGLRFAGVLPVNFFTLYAMQISSMLEILILMLALVERFRLLHEAKKAAEETARQAMLEFNIQLESLVAERTHALEQSNEELRRLARTDSLTGLLNHRAAIQEAEKALAGARRYNFALAIVMVDIDHFKLLNDRYGHQAGDEALSAVAGVLCSNLRETDVCGRYGGEEFILILTHTNIGEAKALGSRIKQAVAETRFNLAPGAQITASLGIAMCYPTQCGKHTADSLINAADKALYQAKNQGRNRVCMAPTVNLSST